MNKVTKHFLISGRVQGVGFRAFVRMEAENLQIQGWVRNLQDGRVEALVTGAENQILHFEKAVMRGPNQARVVGVEERLLIEVMNFDFFGIVTDGEKPWSE